ncbi:MAG TPA: adenylate/guanylate cyclase domain-containing protein [Porticoccaceae bacterium]|nr:adenylate/guanylate cyclase domain-containing protein [Porticoccaceae bacterium]
MEAPFPAQPRGIWFRPGVGLGLAAALISRVADWLHPQLTLLGAAVVTLGYIIGSEWWLRHSNTESRFDRAATLDALLMGLLVGALGFPALLLLPLFALIQCHLLMRDGSQRWLYDNLAFAAGAAVPALLDPQWQLQLNAPLHLVPAAIFGLTFVLYGQQLHREGKVLHARMEKLQQAQIDLKLRNYQLAKYVSPNLREAIESGRGAKLSSQRKRLVVFFSDIVGFSAIADEMDESSLTQIINHYLTEMSKIALDHGGTIDKFIGDAMMVFFGDPRTNGPKDDCLACVAMALAMRQRVIELQSEWRNLGLTRPLEIRMGISTGFCTVGNFGTENRLHYTLLGSEVNLASRLETSARAGEILISHATWLFIQEQILCRNQGEIEVKGFKHPIQVYSVVDYRKNLGSDHPCMDYRTDGFSLFMDLDKIPNYDHNRVVIALQTAFREIQRRLRQPPPSS